MSQAASYRKAGVDLAAADQAKQRIAQAVASTRTEHSRGMVGAFGGMVALPPDQADGTLVMSTDGVGTKVLVACQAGIYDTVGEDLVNHSVNDILVHGAVPLAFQDYIAGAGLEVTTIAAIVEGVARGCRNHHMALTGGETAQMPDVYQPGNFDLAGTIVGLVAEDKAIHGDNIQPGDVLLGYQSSGLHTNGYTLARNVLLDRMGLDLDDPLAGTDNSVGEALLAVHRSYYNAVEPLLDDQGLHGMAHITGGGIAGNLVRVLPVGVRAEIRIGSWPDAPLFEAIRRGGDISQAEMREVFNLGVGFISVLAPDAVEAARSAAHQYGIETWPIGEVRAGSVDVAFVG